MSLSVFTSFLVPFGSRKFLHHSTLALQRARRPLALHLMSGDVSMYSDSDDQPLGAKSEPSTSNGHVAKNGKGRAGTESSLSDDDMPLVRVSKSLVTNFAQVTSCHPVSNNAHKV